MTGPQGAPPSPPLTGLFVWLKTPIAGLVDNDVFTDFGVGADIQWPDSSGNGWDAAHDANVTSPVYRTTSVTINGLPVVSFNAAIPHGMHTDNIRSVADGLTEASIYIVGRINNDPPASQAKAGLITLNNVGDFLTEFPGVLSSDEILSSTFRSARVNIGDPATSLASPFYYGVLSQSADYKVRLNGSEIFSTGTNTFATTDAGVPSYLIGHSFSGTFNFWYDGVIAEILIYDHFLDAGEITDIETYLADRFAI